MVRIIKLKILVISVLEIRKNDVHLKLVSEYEDVKPYKDQSHIKEEKEIWLGLNDTLNISTKEFKKPIKK